jgi:hypothetical protein
MASFAQAMGTTFDPLKEKSCSIFFLCFLIYMAKFVGFTKSVGQISMVNNVNGKEGKVNFDWDGNLKTTKPKKATIELHTNFNGRKNNLKLQNADITNLKSNNKFKQFFARLSRTNNKIRKTNGQLSAVPTASPDSLSMMSPPATPYPLSATPYFRRRPMTFRKPRNVRGKTMGRKPRVFRGRRPRGAATRRRPRQ